MGCILEQFGPTSLPFLSSWKIWKSVKRMSEMKNIEMERIHLNDKKL